jgi:hypothetical protein
MGNTSGIENNTSFVELTDKDAKLFIIFRKYQGIWEKIFDSNPKSIEITLFIDREGTMRMVKTTKTY